MLHNADSEEREGGLPEIGLDLARQNLCWIMLLPIDVEELTKEQRDEHVREESNLLKKFTELYVICFTTI